MLWSLKKLLKYTLLTTDGKHEHVVTTLFDEAAWALRYLIVKPEGFSPTPVMIAVTAMNAPNWVAGSLPLELTMEQVNNSPTIVMNMLMTPSTQKRLNECYALYQYWALSGYASSSLPLALIASPEIRQPETTTFRDMRDLLTMTITAHDGTVGTVDDVMMDDEIWAIRSVVVNGNSGELGKSALIPPELIEAVDWQEQTMTVDVSLNHIRTAPTTQPQGGKL